VGKESISEAEGGGQEVGGLVTMKLGGEKGTTSKKTVNVG